MQNDLLNETIMDVSTGTACPGQWLSCHPWRHLKDVQMWGFRDKVLGFTSLY